MYFGLDLGKISQKIISGSFLTSYSIFFAQACSNLDAKPLFKSNLVQNCSTLGMPNVAIAPHCKKTKVATVL